MPTARQGSARDNLHRPTGESQRVLQGGTGRPRGARGDGAGRWSWRDEPRVPRVGSPGAGCPEACRGPDGSTARTQGGMVLGGWPRASGPAMESGGQSPEGSARRTEIGTDREVDGADRGNTGWARSLRGLGPRGRPW